MFNLFVYRSIFFVLFALFLSQTALAANSQKGSLRYEGSLMAPQAQPLQCFNQVSINQDENNSRTWSFTYHLTLANDCSPDQLKTGVKIAFQSSDAISSFWYAPYLAPSNVITGKNPVITTDNAILGNPQTVSFNVSFNQALTPKEVNAMGDGIVKSVSVYPNTPAPPKKDGEIDVNVGAMPSGWQSGSSNQYPAVTFLLNHQEIASHTFSSPWNNNTFAFDNLEEPGQYTVETTSASSGGHTFTANQPQQTISLRPGNKQVNVGFTYTEQLPHNGMIQINMPINPTAGSSQTVSQVTSEVPDQIQASITDESRQEPTVTENLSWRQSAEIDNLIPGDAYRVSFSPASVYYVGDNQQVEKGTFQSDAKSVKAGTAVNQEDTLTESLSSTTLPTATVAYKIATGSGVNLPNKTGATLHFTGGEANSSFTLTDLVPVDDQEHLLTLLIQIALNVAAESIRVDGNNYDATIKNPQITLKPSGNSEQTITYQKPSDKLMVGYADYTIGTVPDDLITQAVKHGYNTIVIGFASVDANNTASINAISQAGYQRLQELYADIQKAKAYAVAHQINLKLLVSFGGANNTYQPSFTSSDDQASAQKIASSIEKNVLTVPVPNTNDETIHFDGADFDMDQQIGQLVDDKHFAGLMSWNINDEYTGGDYINPSATCYQNPWAYVSGVKSSLD